MSRAFVRERDDDNSQTPPDLRISPHPNRVTRRGLKLMEANIVRIKAELREHPEEHRTAWLHRDLRYWTLRHATAQVTEPIDPTSQEVTFGSWVTIARDGHQSETLQIVGEDESDPATGHLSWMAPLAVALMGAQPGETVTVGNRHPPQYVEIIAVNNDAAIYHGHT